MRKSNSEWVHADCGFIQKRIDSYFIEVMKYVWPDDQTRLEIWYYTGSYHVFIGRAVFDNIYNILNTREAFLKSVDYLFKYRRNNFITFIKNNFDIISCTVKQTIDPTIKNFDDILEDFFRHGFILGELT